jgi:hypothetical protein
MPVQETSDGGFILGGIIRFAPAGDSDIILLKLDSKGNIIWQKAYGMTRDDIVTSIVETPDGGYEVECASGSLSKSVIVFRLDGSGNLVGLSLGGKTPLSIYDTSVIARETAGGSSGTFEKGEDTSRFMKK